MTTLKVNACIIDTEKSISNKFAKDQRPYKYDDLQFAIENPIDFESLRVNGFPEVKDRFERQGMVYYFDVMNGPTYTELVKEFWMKESIIAKDKYNENLKQLIKEKPELRGKSPAEMGIRPFVTTEIESFVAGFRVSIRVDHIFEALKLSDDGLFIKSTDCVGPDVDEFIFKPKADPKDKLEMTNLSKVIYKILIDSIISKLGGTGQFSTIQKLFTFHVGKGNFVDVGKLLFIHLADSIASSKPIIRYGRLLSHMFAQCGLLDAIKPFFPGYGTYLISSKIINSTTLRYLQLVKTKQIVHPTYPLLFREIEEDIGECRLIHVSDRDARKIVEAHAGFLKSLGAEVGSGETQELTVRQSRILEQPTRVSAKRKAVKSPAASGSKKVAKTKKSTGPRTSKKPKVPRKLLLDLSEEEKEKADLDAAIAKVEALKEKEVELKDGYECGIDAKEFDDMHSKLPQRNDPDNLLAQQTLYGPADGKNPTYLGNSSAFKNVFKTFQHPPLIPVKRAFDKIFKGVYSKKDIALSENQPLSEPFNTLQTNPSESQTNNIYNDAAQATTSTAPVIHSVDEDEDSDRTPSPPPQKYILLTNKEISILEPSPEPDETQPNAEQNKPQTSSSENDQNNQPSSPPIAEQTNPTSESHKSPEPNEQINPDSEVAQKSNSTVTIVEKSPHHVALDNTITEEIPTNHQTPPHHTTDPNTLMQNLSDDCIYVPPTLPFRILNEPMDETKEDITKMLQAVDKNIRRIQNAIPNRSIESAEIDKECELMEIGLQNMIRAIRESYKRDLEFRKELARLEAKKIEQEKREAEEGERKRLEDERIEKERLEALAREEARLAEEARTAAEQARIERIASNAPEFALLMRQDQDNLKKKVDAHSDILVSILETLKSIDARLPPPPPHQP
ncbi:hypothetical protein QL285_033842 [Trifolium repens]|nr:hypothetical protein QL285_033842 [Trifolium repens]